MSHIFISYSTKNSDYAYKLANKLRDEGFNVWIDSDELRNADNWQDEITKAIGNCDALILIMSPDSESSKWVKRELEFADSKNKRISPLLLNGKNWEHLILTTTQFKDVRGGSLPDDDFYDDLERFTHRKRSRGSNVVTRKLEISVNDTEIQGTVANPPPLEIKNRERSQKQALILVFSTLFLAFSLCSLLIATNELIRQTLLGVINSVSTSETNLPEPPATFTDIIEATTVVITSALESTLAPTNEAIPTTPLTSFPGVDLFILIRNSANVRSEASSNGDILLINQGVNLYPILGYAFDENSQIWYYIQLEDDTGWVAGFLESVGVRTADGDALVMDDVIADYPLLNTLATPIITPTIPATPDCVSPEITSASVSPNSDGTLPYQATINYSLQCMDSGLEAWVIIQTPDGLNWAWGPQGDSGSLTVALGANADSNCGESFGISVVIATIGGIQSNTGYPTLPEVRASRNAGVFTKNC